MIWGQFLGFLKSFRRWLIRLRKLYTGFLLTKKEILTQQKSVFSFLTKSKVASGFRNFGYEFYLRGWEGLACADPGIGIGTNGNCSDWH